MEKASGVIFAVFFMVLDLSLTKTGDSAESLLCFCYVLQKVFFCVLKPYGITFIKVCL